MSLQINDEYFGELLPYIKNESITDITWNGRDLWLDDLKRGRYKSQVKLSDQFINTFATRIANLANKNFNLSEPLLEAETDDLRISIVDGTVTNTKRSIAIRKTPAVRRLNELKMLEDGYAEAMVLKLLEALVKGHSSIIVTGDVGSGKTELVKYLTKFIPPYERAISIEDNYELRLSSINPNLDCVEIKATMDGPFSYQSAIKAALRQLCKWLLMAEARSKEVINLLEAASTGCIVMTTLHSDDVRKIPDRVVNMMGIDGEEKRNDVYNFFDVGIKVGIIKTDRGIKRSIDQICVMDRDDNENSLYLIYNHGFTGQTLPKNLWQKVVQGAKEDIALFEFLKPDNADSYDIIETPEFAELVEDLEMSMKENLLAESANEGISKFDTPDIENITDVIDLFDEIPEEPPAEDMENIETVDNTNSILTESLENATADDNKIASMETVSNIDDMTYLFDDIQEDELSNKFTAENNNTVVHASPIEATGLIDVPEFPVYKPEDLLSEEVKEEIQDAGRHFRPEDTEISPETFDKYYDDIERAPSAAELSDLDAFFNELDAEREAVDSVNPIFATQVVEPIAELPAQEEPTTEFSAAEITEPAVAESHVSEIPQELKETPENIANVLSLFEQIPASTIKEYGQEAFADIDFEKLEGLSDEALIHELKKQLTINWLNSLSTDELADELRRQIKVIEQCNSTGESIPEHELIRIEAALAGRK